MMSLEKIKSELFATLWELQNTKPNEQQKSYLQGKLKAYSDVLDDEIGEEWWEQIENALLD